MKPGRPRKFDPSIPKHIDQAKLPRGVYWDPRCRIWYAKVGTKQPTVATAAATLAELHTAIEALRDGNRGTLGWLLEEFHGSQVFKDLAPATRRSYEASRKVAGAYKTRYGLLTTLPCDKITTPAVQVVVDAIAGAGTPSKANHLLRYLRRVFTWGVQRGKCKMNPARGVAQAREKREHGMPEATTLAAVIGFLRARGARVAHTEGSVPPYLWPFAVLAYRCRLRGVEVVTLAERQLDDIGIITKRRKGSRDNHVTWNAELKDAVSVARAYRDRVWDAKRTPVPLVKGDWPLFVSEDGTPLTKSSLDSSWQRAMALATAPPEKGGVIAPAERFAPHGLKHRGITDTKGARGDKKMASGHVTDAMAHLYDHEKPRVEPAGD